MLRLAMVARTAPVRLVCALVCVATGCGADDAQDDASAATGRPDVAEVRRGTAQPLAAQRRQDGLEQIDLRGRLQHARRAHARHDGGLQHACEHEHAAQAAP